MVDQVVTGTRSPRVRWGSLAGILVVLLVVYCLCVPFKSFSLTIDRRTGALFFTISYLGIPIRYERPFPAPPLGNPVGKGPLTAPQRRILVRTETVRFFWSKPVTVEHEGIWYAEAFHQMFYFSPPEIWNAPAPNEDVDRIVRQRIPFWNSPELDRNPQAVAEAARQENSEWLGIPMGYLFK